MIHTPLYPNPHMVEGCLNNNKSTINKARRWCKMVVKVLTKAGAAVL